MGEKFNNFKVLIKSILKGVTKRKSLLIASLLSTVFGIIQICGDDYGMDFDELLGELCLSFAFSAVCLFSATYLTEKFSSLKKYLIQGAVGVATAALAYCILEFVEENSFATMYLLGLFFAVVCFSIFLFVPKENSKAYYANFFKNGFFCGVISLAGFLGCMLLVFAFSSLIIEINDIDKVIYSILVFFFDVFFLNLFAFYFFEKREEPSGKAFKILFMYVLLPVYLLLLALLYIYLLKALFTLSLPQGQINRFASFATVFYLVIYFILREYDETKPMKIFYRYGALVLVPLIVVQFVACFIRINAYGFTGWRYSSFLYNIFVAIFVIFTFVKKGRFVKYSMPVLGLFILFGSLTPFNLINMAYNSQFGRMTAVLEKYGMYDGKALTDYNADEINRNISNEDRKALYGSWRYLTWTSEHTKPDWLNRDNSFKDLFKISYKDEEAFNINKWFSQEDVSFDIEGYSTITAKKESFNGYKYNSDNEYKRCVIQEKDLTDEVIALVSEDQLPLKIRLDDGTLLVFDQISFNYDTIRKAFQSYSVHYYQLEK